MGNVDAVLTETWTLSSRRIFFQSHLKCLKQKFHPATGPSTK
jgi:hypothetical protein